LYVAEIAQVLSDGFIVNGFTTTGIPLAGYRLASRKGRAKALDRISFHRTWCKDKGKGEGKIPPIHLEGREKYLCSWRISSARRINFCFSGMSSWTRMDAYACARSPGTSLLAATLKYPHHIGAGG
jgi:hypothetical protein